MTDTPVTAEELARFADPEVQAKAIGLLKHLARLTTIQEEFDALPKNEDGDAYTSDGEEYSSEDEMRADMSDDRLLDEFATLEWAIESARDVLNAMAPSDDNEVVSGGPTR